MVRDVLPDISEYYRDATAAALENIGWELNAGVYQRHATVVGELSRNIRPIRRVIEIGCACGWLAAALPANLEYLGIDKNAEFIEQARNRNSDNRQFVVEDVRNVNREWLQKRGHGPFDLVLCFAVFKHFGLHEWDEIVGRILSLASMAYTDMQFADVDFDNGKLFHHVFVTRERWHRVLASAGHKLINEDQLFNGPIDGHPATVYHMATRGECS